MATQSDEHGHGALVAAGVTEEAVHGVGGVVVLDGAAGAETGGPSQPSDTSPAPLARRLMPAQTSSSRPGAALYRT